MPHSSLIDSLFSWSCPAAIARLVIAVRVNAIDRVVFRRSRPHVGVEVLEAVEPSLADRNAASPVASVVFATETAASVFDTGPRKVLARFRHAVSGFRGEHLSFDTAAGVRGFAKVGSLHVENLSAVATTAVKRVFRAFRIAPECEHGQSSKPLASRQRRQLHRETLPFFGLNRPVWS